MQLEESRKILQKTDENLKYAINSNMAATEFLRGLKDSQPNPQPQQEQSQFKVIEYKDTKKSSNKSKKQKEEFDDMKNITKRTDGRWMGRKQIDGNTICIYAKTKSECKEKLTQAIQKPTIIKKQNKTKIKLIDFATTWFETYKKNQIGVKNQTNYLIVINKHLSKITKSIQDITTFDLQTFFNNMPPTRMKEYALMVTKQIFKKAKELKLIKENPCDYIEKGKIQKRKIEWFNVEEQKLILNNLPTTKLGLIIKTLLLTGARPSELNGIKKSDIKDCFLHIKGTKTSNAVRWVKISKSLQDELLSQPNTEIFNYSLKSLQNFFKTYTKSLNITGTLYKLRHTFASNLFYLGVPDKQRQYYMGHASAILTNDIYTTFDPTIAKKDILNLYKDLYPVFDTTFDTTFK